MRNWRSLVALAALAALSGQAAPVAYAEGQVWEYRTRAGEEGSLLKIQQVEADPTPSAGGPIYHISVIGFRLRNPGVPPRLPHAPVSRATLDASVTKLSRSTAAFPDVRPGIAEWRQARGGVFTIGVAEIVDLIDRQTAEIAD